MINSIVNAASATAGTTGSSAATGTGSDQTLNQSDFLRLLSTQLQNQDPTKPMDPSQMLQQIAQISQVQATQSVQSTLTQVAGSLSSQGVAQATGLIGHTVTLAGSSGTLSNGALDGAVGVDTSGADVKVQIVDPASGKVVRNLDLGAQNAGLAKFSWNGKADDGSTAPDGLYKIAAVAGSAQASTYIDGKVTGVGSSGDGSGTYLQIDNSATAPLSQVVQVN